MSWFYQHPEWLYQEARELSNSSLYKEKHQRIGRLLVSSGRIVVRKEEICSWPILIVYPEATPYKNPKVFILQDDIDIETIEQISSSPFNQIDKFVHGKAQFIHQRHQGADGSVCFIETGDLHSERAEVCGIREILGRIGGWLAGRPQKDSREVELFYHFPKRASDLHFLLTDIFFDSRPMKGIFFARTFFVFMSIVDKAYVGIMLAGETEAGVTILPPYHMGMLSEDLPRPIDLLKEEDSKVKKNMEEGRLIRGFWWDIDREPQPFGDVVSLMRYIGNGDEELGIEAVLRIQAVRSLLKALETKIYLGLRFPGRSREKDWQMFRLALKEKKEYIPNVLWKDEDNRNSLLLNYFVEAVRQEYFTEEDYHKRNKGRAERNVLKEHSLSMLGCGAIGSEAADTLCKAGVGKIRLVDHKNFRPHNAIRHVLGLQMTGFAKAQGLMFEMAHHNPFVEIDCKPVNIYDEGIDEYLPESFVGFSSIADDNTEAYLNEQAVSAGRTVFYCRALRGGKAARVFRVVPHEDACKHCLALYHTEGNPIFPKIEEDPTLPEITNECNDPVRPASAADLKIVAGIAARILLDQFQGVQREKNHWIWSTERLDALPLIGDERGSLRTSFIPPHPDCQVCQSLEEKEIFVREDAYAIMKRESSNSKDIETGGILIGYRTPHGKYVVRKGTGPGPKAVRTRTRFQRDVEYCQIEIDRAAAEDGPQGQYVGEWHYHAVDNNTPSGVDIKSLKEIAEQDNYLVEHPVMVIFSGSLECAITIHDKTGRCVKLPLNIFEGDPPV